MSLTEWYSKYEHLGHIYKTDVDNESIAAAVIDDFLKAASGQDIYLYGAGTIAKNYLRLFSEIGDISVRGIFDKDPAKSRLGDYPVKQREEIKALADDTKAVVIVSVNAKYFDEIAEYLRMTGIADDRMINGHYAHLILQSAFCMQKAARVTDTDFIPCWECTCLDNQCKSMRKLLLNRKGLKEDQLSGTDSVYMIGCILSNICSLNCKNCCECIPYHKQENRHFVSAETVIADVKKLSASCRFIQILEFIGGEPFLHPQLGEILSQCDSIPNIGAIHVFSNGTAVPSDELVKLLHDLRIEVYISNYNATLSELQKNNRSKTIKKLIKNEVLFMEGKKEDWADFRSFAERGYSDEEVERNYRDCFLHNCNRLYEGVLYTCPHQYAGVSLGVLEPIDGTVRIHEHSAEMLSVELDKFRSISKTDACRHCKLPYNAEPAISGEQLIRNGGNDD